MNDHDERAFDVSGGHVHFSIACFNACWELIDKAERTAEEDEEMLRLALASHWHWTRREDYGAREAAVAHWQVSRVFALLDEPELARRHGVRSLEAAREGQPPFYEAYAHEALARAAALAGEDEERREHLELASALAARIEDAPERELVEGDLAELGQRTS